MATAAATDLFLVKMSTLDAMTLASRFASKRTRKRMAGVVLQEPRQLAVRGRFDRQLALSLELARMRQQAVDTQPKFRKRREQQQHETDRKICRRGSRD